MADDCCNEEDEWALIPDQHQRTILHLDVDCFYAQVEMVRDPSLRDKPLGIKQKNLMVTCNYVARSLGVKKSMWIQDALKILPNLMLVDGSDLTHYRQFSSEITSVAQSFTPNVERLGLDENYIDITDIVGEYVGPEFDRVEGHVYGDKDTAEQFLGDPCGCGCLQRLRAGTHLAKKLRQQILEVTGITCCAGIAHNKLLAKLVSGYYKPNQQTVLFPWQVHEMMKSLNQARSIPGIGSTTFKTLEDLGISTIQELQNASLNILYTRFNEEISRRLKDLSYGIDESLVKRSGRPQSIGIEDAFKKVNSVAEVQIKYHTLLERLLKLLAGDGRLPGALRVSVRKFDKEQRFGHRETKQVPILASLFSTGLKTISEKSKSHLLNLIMTSFHKMVNTNKTFHLTLIGVGFTKFIERAPESMSISSFFSKRSREENEVLDVNGDKAKRSKITSHVAASEPSNTSANTTVMFKRDPLPSVSTVKDADLSSEEVSDGEDFHKSIGEICGEMDAVGGTENEVEEKYSIGTRKPKSGFQDQLPDEIDREIFESLPDELQAEILQSYQQSSRSFGMDSKTDSQVPKHQKIKFPNPDKGRVSKKCRLDSYFRKQHIEDTFKVDSGKVVVGDGEMAKISGMKDAAGDPRMMERPSCSGVNQLEQRNLNDEMINISDAGRTSKEGDLTTGINVNSEVLLKKGIDPDVFNSLPKELQVEILQEENGKERIFSPTKSTKRNQNSFFGGDSSSILKYFKKK